MLNILKKRSFIKNNPIRAVCISFITIIIIGSLLLFLPISSNPNHNASFLDCLFTSTSATCVTGLSTKDTFSQWSNFGKSVILLLIQTGGLGLITFSSVFLLILNNKLSLKNMKFASSQINVHNLADIKTLFQTIILITFACEFIGAAFLSISYCAKYGTYGVFMAVFSSVAAYCNAGLDLNGIVYENCSFIPFSGDYLIMITISFLTIMGGIGFVTINEVIGLLKNKVKLRSMSINSKIAIIGTIFLICLGTAGFCFLEYDETLEKMTLPNKISNSFFNSTAARTSGFMSVDFSQLGNFTKLFLCILMFVGANPTGTSGGIKITTMLILISTVFSVIKNKAENSIFKHKINKATTYKAISIFFISLFIIFTSVLIIYKTDSDFSLSTVIFTVTSSFSTTGFQIVDSNQFSAITKLILIILMYIGRVGPISFFLMFNHQQNKSVKQLYLPESNLYV